MRILKIRGENLASLADAFTIDLMSEPLRSAGLFAITGETGAGKSTILDAMCLALYGTCPRLKEVGVDDNVTDVSGDRIKSTDPRSVMRMGATHAWAEVEFTGQDGNDYLARWTVRRARGKQDGRLQPVERCLMDLAQARMLEDQTLAVNARVAEVVGLSYDEFRRTVLLPQGEFDAFLQANTGKRAAILEKVTGTEIYRQISRRIYARNSEVRQEVATLETRRGEHRILTAEDKKAVQDEIETSVTDVASKQIALDALLAEEARIKELQTLDARFEQAQGAEALALRRLDETAPQRLRIETYDRALPLKGLFAQASKAERANEDAQADLTMARQKNAAAAADLDLATVAAQKAESVRSVVDLRMKELAPAWEAAAKLDAELSLLQVRREASSAAFDATHQELKLLEGEHQTLHAKLETLNETLANLSATTEQRAPLGKLNEIWSSTKTLIGKRKAEAFSLTKLIEFQSLRQADLERSLAAAARAEESLNSISAQESEQAGRLSALQDEIKLIADAAPAAARDDLRQLQAPLSELIGLKSKQRSTMQQLEKAKLSASVVAEDLEQCRGLLDGVLMRHRGLQEDISDIEAPTLRLEAAASEAAAMLRGHLHDNEPCPVCSSLSHPVLGENDYAIAAAQMRQKLDESRRGLAGVEEEKRRLEARIGALSGDAEAASAVTEQQMRWLSDLDEQIGALTATCLALKAGGDYPALADGEADLEGVLAEISTRIEAHSAMMGRESILIADRKVVEDLIASLRKRGLANKESHNQALLEAGLAKSKLEGIDAELEEYKTRIGELEAEIAPAFELIGRRLADLEQPDIVERIQQAIDWWTDKCARMQEAEREIQTLAPALSAAQAKVLQKSEEKTKTEAMHLSDMAAWKEAHTKRAGLLDGESTEAHKKQWADRAELVRQSIKKNGDALAAAHSALSQADERCRGSAENLDKANEAMLAAKSEAEEALDASGLSREIVLAAHAQSAASIEMLKREQSDLALAAERTKSARQEREADLAEARRSGVPKATADDIRASILSIKQMIKDGHEMIGGLQNRLHADFEARKNLGELDQLLTKAAFEQETWEAVNAAVGQENGNKFAQFAQSVTLGILVERANLHLRRFNPRYQLDHGGDDLSIQVVDSHMAGDRRSTNSISGGERFLVSLSLALALSALGGNGGLAGTIFIDEGFGSLDAESLQVALRALEQLQSEGRTVGIISHVDGMKEHISVKVDVRKQAGGKSRIRVIA